LDTAEKSKLAVILMWRNIVCARSTHNIINYYYHDLYR